MPSKSAIRNAWDASARESYRRAVDAIVPAEEKCFNVSGNTVSFSKTCMKQAFRPLKGPNSPLAQAWTE